MTRRFALLWLRNAAVLFAGSFTVLELMLAAADTSLRALTTFAGFVIVLGLHSVASVGIGLLLTHLLAAIDREAERLWPRRLQIEPLVAPAQQPFDGVARTLVRFCIPGGLRIGRRRGLR